MAWLPSQYAWAQPQAQQPTGWAGVGSALGRNSNLLLGLGAGLLSGNLGAAPQAIAAGAQADTAYAASKKADAERLDQINKTAQWIKTNYPQFANLPPEQGFALAREEMAKQKASPSMTPDIQNYEFGQTHPDFLTYQTQKGGAAETALQPTWGIDNDKNSPTYGQKILGQLNKAGKFVRTAMPEGVSPLDPVDLQGQKAGVTVDAKTAGAARAALPAAEQAYSITKQALDTVQNDPSVKAGAAENFGNVMGVPQQMLPVLPGTNRANFQNVVDQLSGDAFLNIRQALKGAGQVTDYEGQKGEIALSRMAAAAKSGDQKAFQQALLDFNDAIDNGMALLRQQANGDYSQGGPAMNGGNVPSAGKVLTYNPATGELE